LEEAAQKGAQVDLQSILLELTTRLMGNMAYNVRLSVLVLIIFVFARLRNAIER